MSYDKTNDIFGIQRQTWAYRVHQMPRRIQNVLLFYFVPLIAWWRSAKCNGHRMPFRGSASAPNIHYSPISARTLTYCPKNHFFGRASWQANIRWPAMPETRWPNMAALLWVLVPSPGPQRVGDPYRKVKNSKLSYRAHRMLFRKLLTRKTALWYWQYSISNI